MDQGQDNSKRQINMNTTRLMTTTRMIMMISIAAIISHEQQATDFEDRKTPSHPLTTSTVLTSRDDAEL